MEHNSNYIMSTGHAITMRTSKCCKDKWNALHGNYNQIRDQTGHNQEYWDMLSMEHKIQILPRKFNKAIYQQKDDFHEHRPIHMLEGTQDIMEELKIWICTKTLPFGCSHLQVKNELLDIVEQDDYTTSMFNICSQRSLTLL